MFAGKTNGPIWLAISAALFLRALVPAGWMIDVDPGDGAIVLRICEAQTPGLVDEVQGPAHAPVDHAAMGHAEMVGEHERVAQTDREDGSGHHQPEHDRAEPPCVFAGFGVADLPPPPLALVAVELPDNQPNTDQIARLELSPIAYAKPPVRGPPPHS